MNLKRVCLLSVVLLCSVLLSACGGPETTYKQAQSLLSKGQYAEAGEKFESIGSYEDAATLTMYCKACALCESGDFATGIQALERLGDYKDCTMRITYYTARSWDDSSVGTTEYEWMQRAKSIYSENPLYLDSAIRISALDDRIVTAKQSLYDNAVQAGDNGQYSTAIQIFERLSDYSDSEQRYTYYNIRADEEALTTSTDETAVFAVATRYTKMGAYLDCVDRAAAMNTQATTILDEKYAAAVVLMDTRKYNEAITAFTAIKTYKDSAEKIIACETAILDDKYNGAITLMNAAQYSEAITAFKAIETYRDSATKIRECETAILDSRYNDAEELMNTGKYSEAYLAFTVLNGYKDSAAKATEAFIRYKTTEIKEATVGSYITFGSYEQDNNNANGEEDIEWLVLAKEDDRLLVISHYALDWSSYHSEFEYGVTWDKCSLRTWLNTNFWNDAFVEAEQMMIPTVIVSEEKTSATQDKVFLLSVAEAETYFGSNGDRKCQATTYTQAQWDAYVTSAGYCGWWLRTSGAGSLLHAAKVTASGEILSGIAHEREGSVRPAMWINMNP